MMKRERLATANLYVPVKRRATLKPDTVRETAQSMLEVGQTTPILVRCDGERFVLVHGREAHHSDRRPWHGRWKPGNRSRKFAGISVTNSLVM
jgi:hypothetical protein